SVLPTLCSVALRLGWRYGAISLRHFTLMSRLVSSSSAMRASATIGHQSSPMASLIRSTRSWVRLFGVPRLRPPVFGVPLGRPALAISVSPYFGNAHRAGSGSPHRHDALWQLVRKGCLQGCSD